MGIGVKSTIPTLLFNDSAENDSAVPGVLRSLEEPERLLTVRTDY
jgi:hypothetical protein